MWVWSCRLFVKSLSSLWKALISSGSPPGGGPVLLSLLTAARGSEITALSVENMAISDDDRKVIVYSDSSFVPKTYTDQSHRAPLALEGFFP